MIANYKLIRRIQAVTGWSRNQSELALQAVIKAIREAIIEGCEFGLYRLANFDFWRRKGRTIPPHKFNPNPSVQPDQWILRMKPHTSIRKQVKQSQKQWPEGPRKI